MDGQPVAPSVEAWRFVIFEELDTGCAGCSEISAAAKAAEYSFVSLTFAATTTMWRLAIFEAMRIG